MKTQYSIDNMLKEVKVDEKKWNNLASEKILAETAKALESHNINVIVVGTAEQALEKVKELIPKGSEVMNGTSTTLAEIGYADFLKNGSHGWKNFHETISAENDSVKRSELRRKSVCAEYFLASPNAVSKTGEIVSCDASGSRTGALLFAAKNLILVAGTNKITSNMDSALQRLNEFVFPVENLRAQKVYGVESMIAKIAIIAREGAKGRTTLILVKEKLGY